MANITVRDLTAYSESGSFVRDLSEEELGLQGGGLFKFLKKAFKAIVGVVGVVKAVADLIP
jgi:hypothetical protein